MPRKMVEEGTGHEIQPLSGCGGSVEEWTSFSPLQPLPKPAENLGPARMQKKVEFAWPLQRTSRSKSWVFISGACAMHVLQICIVPVGLSASTIKRLCYFSLSKVSG